jgi:cobaltochelatase CobN
VRKGYWKPDQKVIETLSKEYAETAKEVGLACCDHTCNNPLLTEFTSSVLMSVPGLENQVQEFKQALEAMKNPQPAAPDRTSQSSPDGKNPPTDSPAKLSPPSPDGSNQKVDGYEMQEVNKSGFSAAPIPYLFIAGFLVFLVLIKVGWRKKRDRKGR